MYTGVRDARAWDLARRREGRTVALGLGWWTAALGSIALADVPSSNAPAGMVVFGATVFGAACAVTGALRLDRSLAAWAGTRLLAAAVALGLAALAGRHLLAPTTPALVAYTETPAEVPAILALSVGSFLALYTAGCALRVGLDGGRTAAGRAWAAVGRVRTGRRERLAERTER